MNNARIISNNIKHIRRLNHLTQVDFRRLVNRNQSQVSRWEKGERDIDLNDAVVICSQFGINLSDFLGSDLALTYSLETLQEQEKVRRLLDNFKKLSEVQKDAVISMVESTVV